MKRLWLAYCRAAPALWFACLLGVGVIKAFGVDEGSLLLGVSSAFLAGVFCVWEYAPPHKTTVVNWLTITGHERRGVFGSREEPRA